MSRVGPKGRHLDSSSPDDRRSQCPTAFPGLVTSGPHTGSGYGSVVGTVEGSVGGTGHGGRGEPGQGDTVTGTDTGWRRSLHLWFR